MDPIRPNFKIGTDEGRVKAPNLKLRKKEACLFIKNHLPTLEEKYKFVCQLATCVFNPHNISLEEAWKAIPQNIIKIKEILSNPKYHCLFALLTVETHPATQQKKKDAKAKTNVVADAEENIGDVEDFFKKSPEILEPFADEESLIDTNSIPEQDKSPAKPKKITLAGYPHIHIAIALTAPNGRITKSHVIAQDLFRNTTFGDDVMVGDASATNKRKRGAAKKSNDSENIISYCLKDSYHLSTYINLFNALKDGGLPQDIVSQSTANNTILLNYSEQPDITLFFTEINKRGCIIELPSLPQEASGSGSAASFVPKEFEGSVDTTKKTNVTLRMILKFMSDNNLKQYNNKIYQLVPGSRKTWDYWGTIDKIFGALLTFENEDYLDEILNAKPKIITISEIEGQGYIPTIEINWFYIEFKDFYLHLPSFSIIKGELPKDIALGIFNPALDIKTVEAGFLNPKNMKPKRWLQTIKNQKFYKNKPIFKAFCCAWYKVLLPLIHKDKVFTLYGEPNAGKSTVTKPFLMIFSMWMRAQLSESNFRMESIPSKRLIAIDDTKPETLEKNNILQLFEGGGKELHVDVKYKSAKTEKYNGNFYYCTNEFPKKWLKNQDVILDAEFSSVEEYVLKEQYAVRLNIFRFETQIKNTDPGFMQEMTNLEIAKIILFTGQAYAELFLRPPQERQDLPRSTNPYYVYDTYEEARPYLEDCERIFLPC